MKSGYWCCLGCLCAKSPPSCLPWGCLGFRFKVKTTSMVRSQLPEKGMKVPIIIRPLLWPSLSGWTEPVSPGPPGNKRLFPVHRDEEQWQEMMSSMIKYYQNKKVIFASLGHQKCGPVMSEAFPECTL